MDPQVRLMGQPHNTEQLETTKESASWHGNGSGAGIVNKDDHGRSNIDRSHHHRLIIV